MKHSVIIVVSLILTLCLMGIVSASDNVSAVCDDTQLQIFEEDVQADSIEVNELENGHSSIDEEIDYAQDCNIHEKNLDDLDMLDSLEKPENLNSLGILKTDSLKNLNYLNSLDKQNNLSINFESVKINGKNTVNMLNDKINSSNEYVTYNDADLLSLPLIESDLNDESIMVKDQENIDILFSSNAGLNTANLWIGPSWITGLSSNSTLIKRPRLTGFISNQTIYNNYPQKDLPLEYAIIGVSRDFDDDAFIWNVSDKKASFTVDMVESTDKFLDLNLNEKFSSSYQIGVDASLKALDYFKTQGIDIQKGYPYLYVLTSASYVKINNTSTDDALKGISDVLGLELNKNIFPIHYSLWKDLVFYYLWINDTNPMDMLSYGLKYDAELSELVESGEVKRQGDYIIYEIFSHERYCPGQKQSYFIYEKLIVNGRMNATKVNSTNNTTVTSANKGGGSNMEKIVGNSVAFKGNVNNLFYAIGAIVLITLFFSVVHSKRN